ncbi:putative carboxymethylenebutenolidase, partial [Triangularia verruculosa]
HQTPCVPPSSRARCSSWQVLFKQVRQDSRALVMLLTPPFSPTLASPKARRSRLETTPPPVTLYISTPSPKNSRAKPREKDAILLLTDVFGLKLPENRLLADSFARAGYLTVVPDLFAGSPAPADINDPSNANFSIPEFLARHTPAVTDPIISSTISYIRSTLNINQIAAAGYCFGGKYAFRVINPANSTTGIGGANVAFAAHPSLLTDEEIAGITKPVAVAAADRDELLTAAQRANLERLLLEKGERYLVATYGQTPHGFAVRANYSVASEKFGKEGAFLQAVGWFDEVLL